MLALKALVQPHHAVLCAEGAHVESDECGAPEAWTGCKLIPIATEDGKLAPKAVEAACYGVGNQHHVQPRVISITQASEMGTVYRARRSGAGALCLRRGMLLHMDGARIANAAVSQGLTLRQATRDLGVDILSFGGTKNGLMVADAVVLFDAGRAADFKYLRKQGTQLASKMRFLSAQLLALLSNDLWRRNALHANQMATLLESELKGISGVRIVPVDANAVFAKIPRAAARVAETISTHVGRKRIGDAVDVSWDTTEDVCRFARQVSRAGGSRYILESGADARRRRRTAAGGTLAVRFPSLSNTAFLRNCSVVHGGAVPPRYFWNHSRCAV